MEQVEQLGQPVNWHRARGAGANPRASAAPPTAAPALDSASRPPPGPEPLQTEMLVLQPTPFCNLDCSYCYLPQRGRRARMAPATARWAARHLRDEGLLGSELTVVWHAGEPMVLPPAYYEEAFAAVAEGLGAGAGSPRPGALRLTHALQTNGTLLDEAWCDFLQRHRVAIGLSVDGPAALHDRHRRTRRGAGTHAAVARAIARLQARGLPFHAIAVVTADTLADPDAFYDWFEAQGITALGCNIDEAEGPHAASSLAGRAGGPDPDSAPAAFIARLLERSRRGRVVVRELAAAWQGLRQPPPGGREAPHNPQTRPLAIVSVAHDGGFSTFSPELLGQPEPAWGGFVLGNVHHGGYRQALQREPFTGLWREIAAGVDACERRCPWFALCGGGAPVNKWYEHGSFAATETLYCRSMVQRPLAAVLRQAEIDLGLAA